MHSNIPENTYKIVNDRKHNSNQTIRSHVKMKTKPQSRIIHYTMQTHKEKLKRIHEQTIGNEVSRLMNLIGFILPI